MTSVDKPVNRGTYPRDIATPNSATLPPPPPGFDCDIATPLKPIAFSNSKTDSSHSTTGDNQGEAQAPNVIALGNRAPPRRQVR